MAAYPPAHQPVQVLARVTGLLIGCLIFFVLLFSLQSWRDEKVEAVEALFNIMELERQAIDSYFARLENAMRVIGEDLGDLGSDDALSQGFALIKRFHAIRPELFNITVLRADGQILFTAKDPPAPGLPSLADQPSFLQFKEELGRDHDLIVGRPLVSMISKQWIIPVRYPLRDADDRLRHVISGNLPLTFLQDYWKDAPFTRKASLGLMRDDGYLLARHPVPSKLDMATIYSQPRSGTLINHLRQQHFPSKGYVEGPSSLDGPDFLTSYLRLTHFPITLFIALPVADIRAIWWDKVRVSYTLIVLLLAIGITSYLFILKQQRAREKEQLVAAVALDESKRQYDEMVAMLPVGIFRMRTTQAGIMTFEYVSPRWCELMQLASDIVLSDPQVAYGRTHPDDLPGLLEAEEAVRRHLGEFTWQGRIVIASQVRFLQIESRPRKLENGDILWTGMIADITLRIQLEEQQQQLLKAESLARMAGAVAHHFNNKLQVIMGRLELARAVISKDHEAAAYNIIESQKAAEQAAEVSLLMLNYLGNRMMNFEALDLDAVCQEAVNVQARLLPDKIELVVVHHPQKLIIMGDKVMLVQAMTSIFNNAREAIGDGPGCIRLSTSIFQQASMASFTLHPKDWQPEKGSYACLEISDNGCGIEGKNLNLIFDPFFSTKFTGRGLGLAVALGTVRSHGGAIAVSSESGHGTIFRIFLPLEGAASLMSATETYADGVMSGKQALAATRMTD